MRTVAAFLLCVLGGNATPSADDVSKVITAVGGEADADSISKLLKDMEGKVELFYNAHLIVTYSVFALGQYPVAYLFTVA
jgi:ribosomal protein L12E/L44/L45/RPP1/RPP2